MNKNFAYPNTPIGYQALPCDFTGENNLGIYTIETTQRFMGGTRFMTWDGRIYKYGKSSGVCDNDCAVQFLDDEFQTYTAIDAASPVAIGSTSVIINGGTHDAVAKNELAGGYVLFYTANNMFRGIAANDVAAANADFTLHLDAPTSILLVAASTGSDVWRNPWMSLASLGADGTSIATAKAGIAVTKVTASSQFFWTQTWGPCWAPPQVAAFQAGTYLRTAYWRHDGSIDATAAAGTVSNQIAGYFINEGFTSGPLLYLMCSI